MPATARMRPRPPGSWPLGDFPGQWVVVGEWPTVRVGEPADGCGQFLALGHRLRWGETWWLFAVVGYPLSIWIGSLRSCLILVRSGNPWKVLDRTARTALKVIPAVLVDPGAPYDGGGTG